MCPCRKVDGRYVARKREALRYFSIESAAALTVALFINVACVAVFAVGFYGKPGADEIGLENAGECLGEAFGQPMRYIWAIGLLAAGGLVSYLHWQYSLRYSRASVHSTLSYRKAIVRYSMQTVETWGTFTLECLVHYSTLSYRKSIVRVLWRVIVQNPGSVRPCQYFHRRVQAVLGPL